MYVCVCVCVCACVFYRINVMIFLPQYIGYRKMMAAMISTIETTCTTLLLKFT